MFKNANLCEVFGSATTHTRKIEIPEYISLPHFKAFSKGEALTSRRVGGTRFKFNIPASFPFMKAQRA